jgi:hypothetical protein
MNTPHKNQKHFAGGIDNGFGNYKLLIEGHELVVIPSYLTEEKMEAVPGRVRLGDHEYTVGDSARRCGKYFTRNVDDASSKLQYALPMLLGALAHLPHRKEWYLHLAASIHDSDNLGQGLIETLSGEYECILSGMPSRVLVDVVKVVPEGMGSLVDMSIPKKLTLVDFGNGTTLLSRYNNGKREMHEPVHFGVENLIELIAKEMKGSNNGLPGESHLIRIGLESGKLNYGRSQTFKPIYKKCLTDWFDKYLKKTLKKAKDAYEQGDEVWCIGGGCLLPGFADNLRKAGFKVHESPIDANVKGLMSIAKKSMRVRA